MSTQPSNIASLMRNLNLPSLEDACMLSVAQSLMEQDNINKHFHKHFSTRIDPDFSKASILEIISVCKSLRLPDSIESKLSCALCWVVKQYFDWMYLALIRFRLGWKYGPNKENDFVKQVMDSVIWGANGTVNYQLSIRKLISSLQDFKDEESLVILFKLASMYCLEGDIKLLWSKLSRAARQDFFEEEGNYWNDFFYEVFKHRDTTPDFYFSLYWASFMKKKMKIFVESFLEYVRENDIRYCDLSYSSNKNLNEFSATGYSYAFILSVFEGNPFGVNFYSKSPQIQMKHIERIIEIYLKRFKSGSSHTYENAVVLCCLLNKIQNNDFVDRIFKEYYEIFLKLSVEYWPWHKFLASLVNLASDSIDHLLFYDLITKLLHNVKKGNTDMIFVKQFWRDAPTAVKKSFCTYISKKQKRDCKSLWKNVTIDAIDMFLREDELKKILTPYKNYGITLLMVVGRYNVINHWLKKCLISEEAIISFKEKYLTTIGCLIIKDLHTICMVNCIEFLDWAFKEEHLMNKKKILFVKDLAIIVIAVPTFVTMVKCKSWDYLRRFIDWVLKNRDDDYQNELIQLKRRALLTLFETLKKKSWNEVDFVKKFMEFISYGINNADKLNRMMKEIDVHEGEFCSGLLLEGDWKSIEIFLKFLSEYDRDIFKVKKNILVHIFSNDNAIDFKNQSYYKNIKKLLCWNCETDEDMRKIREIVRLIIRKYAEKKILWCLVNRTGDVLKNILKFFYEDNIMKLKTMQT